MGVRHFLLAIHEALSVHFEEGWVLGSTQALAIGNTIDSVPCDMFLARMSLNYEAYPIWVGGHFRGMTLGSYRGWVPS